MISEYPRYRLVVVDAHCCGIVSGLTLWIEKYFGLMRQRSSFDFLASTAEPAVGAPSIVIREHSLLVETICAIILRKI